MISSADGPGGESVGDDQVCSPAEDFTEDVYSAARGMAWETQSFDTPRGPSQDRLRRQTQRETMRVGLNMVSFDIPEDSYGAAILAIVKDMHYIGSGEESENRMSGARFMSSIVLLFLNLICQFLILWFISKHVVRPAVRAVQLLYRDFHKTIYDEEGMFQMESWHEWEMKAELCQMAMTNHVFYYLILFLWSMSMMQEFRTAERLFRNIASMPPCVEEEEMLEAVGSSGMSIVALTSTARNALYVLVCFPKLLISGFLWWCGAEWLSATTSFQDLVLNTVAMTFVTQIDEVLYMALLPVSYKKCVKDINFTVWQCKTEEEKRKNEINAYWRSATYLIFGTVIQVFVYSNYLQAVLPSDMLDEVKINCRSYLEKLVPLCDRQEFEAEGGMHSCFPYGR